MPRNLRVEFRTEESFRREYAQNISNGGLFVETREEFEPREMVEVELVLVPQRQSVSLRGEVVHQIGADLAPAGAEPGVAIQFALDLPSLRRELATLSAAFGAEIDERPAGGGRRAAPRFRARIPVRLRVDDQWIDAHTRNVSSTGILVVVSQPPLPIGQELTVVIEDSSPAEEMTLLGVVVRCVEGAAQPAMGIEFRVPESRRGDVIEFVDCLRAVEHTRRLGRINGPIAEIGIESVLRMFGSAAPNGTLCLTRGEEEGYVTIDDGALRATLGELHGQDALDSVLGWTDGHFQFEANVDEALVTGPAVRLAEVLSEGARPRPASPPEGAAAPAANAELADVDELLGEDAPLDPVGARPPEACRLPPETSLRVDTAALAGARGNLCKIEEAVIDLACVGMTVGKIVAIVPEPDDDVYRAMDHLLDVSLLSIG